MVLFLLVECTHPWLNLVHSGEQFCLRFETKYLLDIGNGMDYILTAAVQSAASEALKYTVLSGMTKEHLYVPYSS